MNGGGVGVGRGAPAGGASAHAIDDRPAGVGAKIIRGKMVAELDFIRGTVLVNERAENDVNRTKRFCVGRTIGFERTAQDFDGGSLGEALARDGFGRHGEGELDGIASLLRGKIGNGNRDDGGGRSGLAWRTTAAGK